MHTLVACPACEMKNELPGWSRRSAVFACGNCEEELPRPVPFHAFLVEAARFFRNAFLVLGLPAVAAFIFLQYPDLRFTSGFVFTLSLTIASVAFHEFFHAITAFMMGDSSVYHRGYLRLNPLKYLMGLHSLLVPVVIFMFSGIFLPGAAVYIRFDRIHHPLARSFIFLSGVLANAAFLAGLLVLLKSGMVEPGSDFDALLQFAAFCQICIIVFNLLPVPGLDGWGVIAPIFAQGVQKLMNALSPLLVLGFAVLLISSESVNRNYVNSIANVVSRFGLEIDAIDAGKSYAMIVGPGGCGMCRELSRLSADMRK